MYRYKYLMLIEIALFAAVALLLDIVTTPFKLGPWISLSFKMLPIFIVAFRWGLKASMISGFLWGLLQIISGQASGGILSPLQALIEYFIAFSVIGISGIFKPFIDNAHKQNNLNQKLFYSILAIILGSSCRYLCHIIAGFVFWGQFAPKNVSIFYYVISINGASWFGETLACIMMFCLIRPLLNK